MYVGDRDTFDDVFCQDCGRITDRETLNEVGLCEDCDSPKKHLDYRVNANRKTTADVFFRDSRKNLRGCEAWINADGTLFKVILDDEYCDIEELQRKGVAAVDFYVKTTLYL